MYFSVKFLLLSQSHTCNKVHVIPSLIYFMAFCCFVYMFNNHCFSQIYFLFAVVARYMSIISLQQLGLHLLFVLVCTLSVIPYHSFLRDFHIHLFIIFILLCACPLSQHPPCASHSFPLLATFSLRTFISYL